MYASVPEYSGQRKLLYSTSAAFYLGRILFLDFNPSMGSSSDTKVLHRLIRSISSLAVDTFFHEVRVIGGENVPKDGPIIVYVVSVLVL